MILKVMIAHTARCLDDRPAGPDRQNRKVVQILAAARSLFLDHSFEFVTMDMVTRASGVSKATLYVHFASKEDLFAAVMIDETRLVSDEIWCPRKDGEDVVTVLRRVARNFVEIFMTERALLFRRAIVGAIPRFPAIGRTIYESGPRLLGERVATFLAEADRDGLLNVPNPALAAIQFLSVVRCDMDIRGMLSLDLPSAAQIEMQIDEGIAMFMARYAAEKHAGCNSEPA